VVDDLRQVATAAARTLLERRPPAPSTAASNDRQPAFRIDERRLSSASSTVRASAFGAIDGAPKSVVPSPSKRSTTWSADASSGASNPSLVPRRTLA
jgi:hypothetical protein